LHKHAVVHPRLKKQTLDAADVSSYRPISNLSFVSKLVERVVASRFVDHAESQNLFPSRQSAYRRHHSTETAVVSVLNDVIQSTDAGRVVALVLLDLSAAFDTVDHTTLFDVLHCRFAVDGVALDWFRSYLTGRTQTEFANGTESEPIYLLCGVPQGSVLGPQEFISYIEKVADILQSNSLSYHLFADDMQMYKSVQLEDIDSTRQQLALGVKRIQEWCASYRLQLNAAKTELLWFGSRANLQKISGMELGFSVGSDYISPSTVIRNLGVYLDSQLTMKQHISHVTKVCFYQLRRLRQIRRYLGPDTTARLVSAFILSRLDYCNAVLARLPSSTIQPFQRVQNAAARLIADVSSHEHVSPVLRQLHWLPVVYRIDYKLCLLMHYVHIRHCPDYLRETVSLVADSQTRPGLRSASSLMFRKPRTSTVFGERAFSFAGPAAWNCLPLRIQQISDTTSFKRHLKTFLFSKAFLS